MKKLHSHFKIWNRPSRQPQAICRGRRLCALVLLVAIQGRAEVTVTSPGLAPSRMDDRGGLVEDWGNALGNGVWRRIAHDGPGHGARH